MAGHEGSKISGPLVFDCPVCFEILLPPIYQCYNGHLICNSCLPQLTTCAVCRKEMPEQRIRNLVMEELVRQKEFACPNHHLGCSALMKYPMIEEHQIDCLFTEMNFCQFLGMGPCDKSTKAEDLVEHLKKDHEVGGKLVMEEGTSAAFCLLGTLPKDLAPRKALTRLNFIVQGGNTFFLRTKITLDGISWLISVLGSSDVASKFKAKIKLVPPNENQDAALSWQGRVCGLRSKFDDNNDVFSASFLQTKLFWCEQVDNPEHKGLSFQVSIKKKEDKSLTKHHDLTEVETLVDARCYTEADEHSLSSSVVNETVECDGCLAKPITGPRYTCIECPNYDLCKECVGKNIHSNHLLVLTKAKHMEHKLTLVRDNFRTSVVALE